MVSRRRFAGALIRVLLGAFALVPFAHADNPGEQLAPTIAIIIDDLGRNPGDTAVIDLQGPVACAFLPHAPHTRALARRAHRKDKEVMVHLPMQSMAWQREDPGALTMDMTRHQFRQTLARDIEAVPFAVGINNHMGSLLTRHPGYMAWLMSDIHRRGNLFFVDSRTSAATVARKLAIETGVPNTRRDVFLDNHREPEYIRDQFRKLILKADQQGTALAIGHPYPETLAVLARELVADRLGPVRLVPVSRLIDMRDEGEHPWHVSSFP